MFSLRAGNRRAGSQRERSLELRLCRMQADPASLCTSTPRVANSWTRLQRLGRHAGSVVSQAAQLSTGNGAQSSQPKEEVQYKVRFVILCHGWGHGETQLSRNAVEFAGNCNSQQRSESIRLVSPPSVAGDAVE